jgi:hypothetical protein
MKRPLRLSAASLAALACISAGCGGGSSSSSSLAGIAAPGTLIFVEGTVRPSGEVKANTDRAAATIAGVDNLGDFVVEKLEEEAQSEDEPFNFEKEVEPWLGDQAALGWESGEDSDPLMALETTDAGATRDFIDRQAERSEDPYRDASYEGIDFKVGGDEENAVGVIDDFMVVAEDEEAFRGAVDASDGDSLADEDRFQNAMESATEESLADVYLDIGGLLEQSGDEIDPQARQLLQGAGIDPSEASAVASVVPGAESIEVDLSSELGGEEPPSGDASPMLGSLPADSFAAFAVSGFGDQLQEAIDSLDESGIPGEIPPNKLKSGLKQAGIDLESIAASLGDAGAFATGRSEGSLGGALVVTTDDPGQAKSTVDSIGGLLRLSDTPGVTAVNGKASGFSIRSEDLGRKPLVVVARGDRLAIGYGVAQTLRGISGGGATLADSPAYKQAVEALGGTPISAFVDGPAALALANSLVPATDTGYREARQYLDKIASVALGSSSEGDRATAKLIVALEK